MEVEGAAVTEGEDDHGGAIEGGEGGEDGVEHSRERINEVGRWGEKRVCFGERRGRFGEMSGCVVEWWAGCFGRWAMGRRRRGSVAAKGGFVLTMQR